MIKYGAQNNIKSMMMKLFISYLGIVIIIICSGIFVYQYTRNILINKEIEYSEVTVGYIQDIVDKEIKNIYKEGFEFFQDKNNDISLKKIENIYEQSYIINQLKKITVKSKLIDDAILYNKNLDSYLSKEGSISKTYLEQDKLEKYIEEMKTNNEYFNYIPEITVTAEGKDKTEYLAMCFLTPYERNNMLILLVSKQELGQIFDRIDKDKSFVIRDKFEDTIVSSGKELKNIGKIVEVLGDIQETEQSVIYEDELIVYTRSEFFEWYYICSVSMENILSDIRGLKNLFVCIMGIVTGGCLIIGIVSSNKNYTPIKRLVNDFNEKESLYNIIKYGDDSLGLTEEFDGKDIIAIYVSSRSKDKLIEYNEEIQRIYKDIKRIEVDKNESYYIIIEDKLDYEVINRTLEGLHERYKDEIVVGISEIAHEKSDIKGICKESFEAIKKGSIVNEKRIYEHNKVIKSVDIYFPMDFEVNVINCIQTGNKKSIYNIIGDIFESNKNISNDYMENIITEFISIYIKLAQRFKIPYVADEIKESLRYEYDIAMIRKYIEQIYSGLVKEEIVDDKSTYVANYIKGYIEKKYGDSGITIELIASEIELSAPYVSTLFKKEMGIAFTQYLADYRIEKAKYLLEHTDKKVKDIAEEIGFGTYHNFNRVFKKKTGVIPSEYKKYTIENVSE